MLCTLIGAIILSINIQVGLNQGGASARLSEVKNESRRDFTPTPH